jgi:malate dehydrogenase
MYPDLFNAKIKGQSAWEAVDDEAWVADEFIPRVGKRGAEIIEARGASSAASAANAAIDHVRDWMLGADGLRSMAVPTTGAYGIEPGIVASQPVRLPGNGVYEIVEGLEVPAFSQERIDKTMAELREEREAVVKLGLVS